MSKFLKYILGTENFDIFNENKKRIILYSMIYSKYENYDNFENHFNKYIKNVDNDIFCDIRDFDMSWHMFLSYNIDKQHDIEFVKKIKDLTYNFVNNYRLNHDDIF